ncbi:MAG: amidohydrolase, partial [Planctomycetota bacterium JB042]
DRDTGDPAGGEVVRDGDGEPIGLFRETAMGLLRPAFERAVPVSMRRQAELAARECVAKGVTTFQDAGSSFEALDLFRTMVDEGALPLRLWVMIREPNDALAARMDDYRWIDHGDHRLTVRAVKRMIDGALGPHGAWLLEPYADLPESRGLNTASVEEIEETAALCAARGFQLCIHAIGDRANREVLDLYQRTFERFPGDDRRWRIEHAQHLHPDDVPRFGRLGVIASMQAVHCTSDAVFVPARLGEERAREGAYVWRSLLDTGAVICNGTDAPVEDVDPLKSYAATVTRRLPDGSVFHPEQRLTRMEALRTYTIDGAWAAFQEHDRGSLTVGKLADVVVLSTDILTCDEAGLDEAEVLMTFVGGRLEFARAPRRAAPPPGSGGR